MIVSLIAAMAQDRVIGAANRLPWDIPEDLRYFRRVTRGHPVIMGRKTFESIGKPLPGRDNLVITRGRSGFKAPEGVRLAGSLEEALAACEEREGEVFVIGGAEVYREALPRADRIYITLIEKEFEGDARFPEWDAADFREVSREEHRDAPVPFSFVVLERAGGK